MRVAQVAACCLLSLEAPLPLSRRSCSIVLAEGSRRERRAAFWESRLAESREQARNSGTLSPIRSSNSQQLVQAPLPDPLPDLLKEAEAALESAGSATYDGDRVVYDTQFSEGDRVMVQVTGASALGLSVSMVPSGVEGLVYADEAGYLPEDGSSEPASLGDVLPAFIAKLRDDGKLDVTWRPPGTLPKLEAGAEALLAALLEDPSGALALGDQSSPEAIRMGIGLSKATFKAARGRLLKAKLLQHPLDPLETRLAPAARELAASSERGEASSGGGGSSDGGRCLLLLGLPSGAHFRVSGAAGLLALLRPYGSVCSIRGLVSDGQPSGRAVVWMESDDQARDACDGLRRYVPNGGVVAQLLGRDEAVTYEDALWSPGPGDEGARNTNGDRGSYDNQRSYDDRGSYDNQRSYDDRGSYDNRAHTTTGAHMTTGAHTTTAAHTTTGGRLLPHAGRLQKARGRRRRSAPPCRALWATFRRT